MSRDNAFFQHDPGIQTHRIFRRFTLSQRLEHLILLLTGVVLLFTGLPQKYRTANWSSHLLSTPERVETIQKMHHIAAIILILLVIYHIGKAIVLLAKRNLPGDMLVNWQDVKDSWNMLRYILFIAKRPPAFGKYNFEQKITYWFIFFGIAIMLFSGIISWFPEIVTRVLPGGVIPAAKLAHSDEAIILAIFVVIWHLYHVIVERFNLSMFTGWLNEADMLNYHSLEYKRLTGEITEITPPGSSQQ